jgi:hypothetical protein
MSFALHMFCARKAAFVLLAMVAWPQDALASSCVPPERPYLPLTPEDMRTYADLLRADFEGYIAGGSGLLPLSRCRACARLCRGAGSQRRVRAVS